VIISRQRLRRGDVDDYVVDGFGHGKIQCFKARPGFIRILDAVRDELARLQLLRLALSILSSSRSVTLRRFGEN
jgi:hypothetical protein